MADVAQEAGDAVKKGAGKVGGALKWTFNQLHPFGANGRLGRTLMITTALAGVGFVAAATATTGGLALPFATAASGAGAAGAPVTTGSALLTAAKTFGAHAGNGLYVSANTVWDVATSANWAQVVEGFKTIGAGLTPA